MINRGAAVGAVKNTASVHLEGHLVSLDSDDDGSLSDGSLQGGLRVLLDRDDLLDVDGSLGLVSHAFTSCHGIIRLALETVLLEALEDVVQEGTRLRRAAVLGLSKRQALQLTGRDLVRRLDDLPSKDDALRAHLALVFDHRNHAAGSPVDVGREVVGGFDHEALITDVLRHLDAAVQHVLVLGLSPRRELVVAHGVVLAILGVELGDGLILLGKDAETEFSLLSSANEHAVVNNVLLKLGEDIVGVEAAAALVAERHEA